MIIELPHRICESAAIIVTTVVAVLAAPSESFGQVSSPADTIDRDGDGYRAGAVAGTIGGDCDDSRPDVHPGHAEVCDAVDNDCNGQIDDGVPNDGAGCRDPGNSARASVVGTISWTIRTGDHNGRDDPKPGVKYCVAGWCVEPANPPNWDNRAERQIDVTHSKVADMPWPSGPVEVTIRYDDSNEVDSKKWEIACVQVALDGKSTLCRKEVHRFDRRLALRDLDALSLKDAEKLGTFLLRNADLNRLARVVDQRNLAT